MPTTSNRRASSASTKITDSVPPNAINKGSIFGSTLRSKLTHPENTTHTDSPQLDRGAKANLSSGTSRAEHRGDRLEQIDKDMRRERSSSVVYSRSSSVRIGGGANHESSFSLKVQGSSTATKDKADMGKQQPTFPITEVGFHKDLHSLVPKNSTLSARSKIEGALRTGRAYEKHNQLPTAYNTTFDRFVESIGDDESIKSSDGDESEAEGTKRIIHARKTQRHPSFSSRSKQGIDAISNEEISVRETEAAKAARASVQMILNASSDSVHTLTPTRDRIPSFSHTPMPPRGVDGTPKNKISNALSAQGKTESVSRQPRLCRSTQSPESYQETPEQTLARLGRPSPHVKSVIQFCKYHIPLFHHFQLVQVPATRTSGTARYYWAPRNDLLARCLQHYEAMGYRNTVFEWSFEKLTRAAASLLEQKVDGTGNVGQQRGADILSSCATVLELLSPDGPVPSLFSSRSELSATCGGIPSPSKVEKGWSEGEKCLLQISSHSTFEQGANPFTSFDTEPCLASTEGYRWVSEQEYVAAAVLLSIAMQPEPNKGPDISNVTPLYHSAGPTKGTAPPLAAFCSPSRGKHNNEVPNSFLLRASGFTEQSAQALTVAFSMFTEQHNTDTNLLNSEIKNDLLAQLLTSHPIVHVAIKAIQPSVTSSVPLAKTEQALSFADAWYRQACAIFVSPCSRHNYIMRGVTGEAAGGGVATPFEVLDQECGHRWASLFSVKCSTTIAKWIGREVDSPVLVNDVSHFQPVTISSDIESGSLAPTVERYDPLPTAAVPRPSPTYLLRGCGDTSLDDCKRVWFNFAVKRLPRGSLAQFRLLNMAPHGRLYRSGMRPVCRFDGPLFAVTGRHKNNARWQLVPHCTYTSVRNDEEAEISFAVPLPMYDNSSGSADRHTFRCSHCPSSPPSSCIGCRIKTWLLCGISFGGTDRCTQPALSSTLHISFCEPYSYGTLLSHIALWHTIVKRSPSSIRFEERVLCSSVDGRKLHLLIISSMSERSARQDLMAELQGGMGRAGSGGKTRTSPYGSHMGPLMQGAAGWQQLMELQGFYTTAPPPAVGSFSNGKKVVLLSGRVHPSEVTGSFALHGLIQFLLSSDPKATQLRDNFIFFIVPMLNPDGVARGHNRLDQFGSNLNRCYTNPRPETQPTVLALKNVFDFLQVQYRDRFLMYIDFHSHASQMLGFAFGNCLSAPLQPWNMLFPRLIEVHSGGLFSTAGSKFAKTHMASKDGTSRVIFGASLLHSYTLELTHFAHLHWSPGVGLVGTNEVPGAPHTLIPSHPHEDWESYTKSVHLWDEESATPSNVEPFFVILRQSAEVGRACALALLDYCAVGVPDANAAVRGQQTPPMGRPSEALVRAGGMERLLREVRREATKSLQQQKSKNVQSAVISNRPSWNTS